MAARKGGGPGTNQHRVRGRSTRTAPARAAGPAHGAGGGVDVGAAAAADPLPAPAAHAWGPDRGPDRDPPRAVADMLDLERDWWRHASSREQAIRDVAGTTPARYDAALATAIDRDDALAYDPLLVKRLRRVRDLRARADAR